MTEIYTIDRATLAERRSLAVQRSARETARREFLAEIMDTRRRAAELRGWLDATTGANEGRPELSRLIAWARQELAELESRTTPDAVAAALSERDLFPEIDTLIDDAGDPPVKRIWGR